MIDAKDEKNKTKNKILKEAKVLFSKYGYDGTSIRSIAEACKVNIAAIHYHFKNKPGLYWSVIESSYILIEQGVQRAVTDSETMENLARNLFRFMRSVENDIRSSMKTLLTEGVPRPNSKHPVIGLMTGENFGPPGGDAIAHFLNITYKGQVNSVATAWAVHCLFSSIAHWATMCSTSTFREIKKGKMSDDDIEENTVHLARAIKAYMLTPSHFDKA